MASITIRNLAAAIRARVAPLDGIDLVLAAREPMREPHACFVTAAFGDLLSMRKARI
ncbi:MAG: hypothetical protein HZC25_15265 [Rhodospirillales bacterium]|nr:hypothetical protein [Rhodospirillales bacterium]